MNKEIEWFCYHAVSEELLQADECVAVADAMNDAGIEPDLKVFAQTVVDNELCADVERLEQFMGMALEEARSLGLPPFSIFKQDEQPLVAEPAEAVDAVAAPAAIAEKKTRTVPPPPRPRATATVVAPAGADWLHGWPDLSVAETASPEEAREVMNSFLNHAKKLACSDVHISAGAYPFVRRHKQVHLIPDQPLVSPETSEKLNLALLNEEQKSAFNETHDLDYSYALTENNRYRTNVMLQRLGVAGSYRIVDDQIRNLRQLGFQRPEILEKLTTYHQGLILITGPAGCGKSTTLAAFVDLINSNRTDHIITVEDPIEVVHKPKSCNITQREIGTHTKSFANALRAALREDPDIIVIGELRDLETIEMAIRASETGHLVIGTLHTGSAASTMDRVLDVFPPNQQGQIRSMAAESLKGVICQQLLPNSNSDGVVLAAEIMLGTLAVSNVIREGDTYQLPSIIQTSRNIGMSTMEQSYFDLYIQGGRSYDQTIPLVKSDDLIRQMQTREAQRAADAAGQNNKKKKKWF